MKKKEILKMITEQHSDCDVKFTAKNGGIGHLQFITNIPKENIQPVIDNWVDSKLKKDINDKDFSFNSFMIYVEELGHKTYNFYVIESSNKSKEELEEMILKKNKRNISFIKAAANFINP